MESVKHHQHTKNFKVLFIYPNGLLMNPPPVSIGIFTAILKERGFTVDLFDTTLYQTHRTKRSDDMKESTLQVRPFSYESRSVKLKESDVILDLVNKITTFKPDLIAISILECTYQEALPILKSLESFKIPVIAGGVFATFAPEIVLSNSSVTMVCRGEGEQTLVELCERMSAGKDYQGVSGLCFKRDGKVIKNPCSRPIDLNSLPIPDYSMFEYSRFLRPMAGKVYITIPIEMNRGCPYTCSFCNSPSMNKLYKESGETYFRRKSMECAERELKHLIKKHNAEYVYFSSDNFLVNSDEMFDRFVEMYRNINLPFWIQSRAETITPYRAKKLKEIGCHRANIGLEHGNEAFRRTVINKKFDNQTIIDASKALADAGIPLTVNNIIGFPDETRDLIFDTIELNRKLTVDTTNVAVFAPFHGTLLRQVSLEKGYISDDFICGPPNTDTSLTMPHISNEELEGLRRTFAMYARMPKSYWPKIKRAEKFDEEGNKAFFELTKIYIDKFFRDC